MRYECVCEAAMLGGAGLLRRDFGTHDKLSEMFPRFHPLSDPCFQKYESIVRVGAPTDEVYTRLVSTRSRRLFFKQHPHNHRQPTTIVVTLFIFSFFTGGFF